MIDLPSNKDPSSESLDLKPSPRRSSTRDSGGHLGRRVLESRVEAGDSNIAASIRSRGDGGVYG
jgi:hypothetical protein